MNYDEFLKILSSFADNDTAFDTDKDLINVQIRDEIIEFTCTMKNGSLHVVENGIAAPALQWLVKRVARLDLLARRIIDNIISEQNFINPYYKVNSLSDNSNNQNNRVDTADSVLNILDKRPAGYSSVLYLTSHAGEGKTTLINHLARKQAENYLSNTADWLIIPIALKSRTHIRFDDVVVVTLFNTLRFPYIYYSAFLELVKLGYIIPAFDGFEEMFIVDTEGEAFSALGNLLQNLSSSGSVLISARKAFYEYKSFDIQIKLHDALSDNSFVFSELNLLKWNKGQFLEYCVKRNIADGEFIYSEVSKRLNDPSHPILTRPVLVSRLLDLASSYKNRLELISKLGTSTKDYFYEFVNTIIEREANEKWIDRTGDLAHPLITVNDHHDLLSLLAQEMWINSSNELPKDIVDVVIDVYIETRSKTQRTGDQIKERIKNHALIKINPINDKTFSFDHEEYYSFFLGQSIGRMIIGNDIELITVFRKGKLPYQSIDSAIQYINNKNVNQSKIINSISDIGNNESNTSYLKENCGSILIRLLNNSMEKYKIQEQHFSMNALKDITLNNCVFLNCNFQSTLIHKIYNCTFKNCVFDKIEYSDESEIKNTIIEKTRIHALQKPSNDYEEYDPTVIKYYLQEIGFNFSKRVSESIDKPVELDEEIQNIEKLLRCFLRTSALYDNVLRVRMGQDYEQFKRKVVPDLLKKGIIIEHSGSTKERNYYKLNIKMESVKNLIKRSNGSYQNFLDLSFNDN